MNELVCEGACERHAGPVRRVHVYASDGKDWGTFRYCAVAVDKDRCNGFRVENVEDETKEDE